MSIGEHDTCPYCGHSNLIVGKDDAAVKALVEAAKAIHAHTKNNHQICGLNWALEQAIEKVEGL